MRRVTSSNLPKNANCAELAAPEALEARMIFRIVLALIVFSAASRPALADEASLDFSWDGVETCKQLARSPRITIGNYPTGTSRVLLTLTQGERENGGEEVDLPSSGVLAAGAVTTLGFCNAGTYTWTAVFKAVDGAVLGKVKVNKYFPEK
jgi:hypothetical protein